MDLNILLGDQNILKYENTQELNTTRQGFVKQTEWPAISTNQTYHISEHICLFVCIIWDFATLRVRQAVEK